MREHHDQLDALGVDLLGVGTREPYQAARLTDDGIGVELLLDPRDQIRTALDASSRFSWWRLLHPAGARSYVRAARQANRFDPIWAEANQRPGLVLLDADFNLVWSRMGARIGDYPTPDEVIDAVGTAID